MSDQQPQTQPSYPVPPQAVPLAVDQTAQAQLNPPTPSGAVAKELAAPVIRVEGPQVEQVGDVHTAEQLGTPEIPLEVEAYLKRVEDHQDHLPKEVVIADGSVPHSAGQYMAQPVIVLPITPQTEQLGAKKNPQFSVRWLVEWSRKIMKMFFGKVVYRQAEAPTAG